MCLRIAYSAIKLASAAAGGRAHLYRRLLTRSSRKRQSIAAASFINWDDQDLTIWSEPSPGRDRSGPFADVRSAA